MIRLADAAATERLGRGAGADAARRATSSRLSGTLGAGKTTLCARHACAGSAIDGDVASPTFPIVQAYAPPETRVPLWHVDLYRIERAAELEELGLDEAREAAALLIEWPERLPHLWADALRLALAILPDGARALTAQVPPAWGGRWPPT